MTVCTDMNCSVHDPEAAARRARQEEEHPSPVMAQPKAEETEEQASECRAEYEHEKQQHEAESRQREEQRHAESDQQRKQAEAEREQRAELRKQRHTTLERIVANAPATFTAAQMRFLLRTLVYLDPYGFLEAAANHFAGDDDHERSEEEIVLAALDSTTDDKLTGFAFRLALTDHINSPHDGEPDLLTEAEQVFRAPKSQKKQTGQKKPTPIRPAKAKKAAPAKKRLAV